MKYASRIDAQHTVAVLLVLFPIAILLAIYLSRVEPRQSDMRDITDARPLVWLTAVGELAEPDGKAVVTLHRERAEPDPLTVHVIALGTVRGLEKRVGTMTIPADAADVSCAITVTDDAESQPEGFVRLSIVPDPATMFEHPVPLPPYRYTTQGQDVLIRCVSDE